jgi:hypothetical protein
MSRVVCATPITWNSDQRDRCSRDSWSTAPVHPCRTARASPATVANSAAGYGSQRPPGWPDTAGCGLMVAMVAPSGTEQSEPRVRASAPILVRNSFTRRAPARPPDQLRHRRLRRDRHADGAPGVPGDRAVAIGPGDGVRAALPPLLAIGAGVGLVTPTAMSRATPGADEALEPDWRTPRIGSLPRSVR